MPSDERRARSCVVIRLTSRTSWSGGRRRRGDVRAIAEYITEGDFTVALNVTRGGGIPHPIALIDHVMSGAARVRHLHTRLVAFELRADLGAGASRPAGLPPRSVRRILMILRSLRDARSWPPRCSCSPRQLRRSVRRGSRSKRRPIRTTPRRAARFWSCTRSITATSSRPVCTGTAEGIVAGARRTIPLAFDTTSRRGSYALRKQWPSDGMWMLVINTGGQAQGVTALVDIGRQGDVARVRVPTQARRRMGASAAGDRARHRRGARSTSGRRAIERSTSDSHGRPRLHTCKSDERMTAPGTRHRDRCRSVDSLQERRTCRSSVHARRPGRAAAARARDHRPSIPHARDAGRARQRRGRQPRAFRKPTTSCFQTRSSC